MTTTLPTAGWRPVTETPLGLSASCRTSLDFSLRRMDETFRRTEIWPLALQTRASIHVLMPPTPEQLFESLPYRCRPRPAGEVVVEHTPIVGELEVIPSVVTPQTTRVNDPVAAVDDLLEWMQITHDELSAMTGIGRTTFFYWKKKGAAPHPKTMRPLWRLHSLGEGVVRALGEGGAARWFNSGSPSPRELLMAGDTDAAENLAHRLLFQQPSFRESRFAALGEEDLQREPSQAQPGTRTVRRASRRPVRRRLG